MEEAANGNLLDRMRSALADRYDLVRELGEGGMAVVFLARDLKHERLVALKVLRPEVASVVGHDRFLNEIRTTATLAHPHVLSLIDSGDADGLPYYVMPYVEGESLASRLKRERQLSVAEAIKITADVAAALSHAHRLGVIHRDIKPANILLYDGEAVVADFGIALALAAAGGERLTGTGFTLGTPQYMSPEQAAADRELDARSDIYSLGCVLYEMLAGEPPHTGATIHAVMVRVMSERPTSLSALRNIPPHVEAAVEKALAKVPSDRFALCSEFAAALTGPVSQGSRWWRISRPSVGRSLAVAALVVAAALVMLLVRGSGPRNAQQGGADPVTRQVTFSGGVNGVSLAPDGQMIAYLDNDRRTLITQDIASDQQVRVLESDTPLGSPRWSPDGTTILVSAEVAGRTGLHTVPRLGGDPRLVVEMARGEGGRPAAGVLRQEPSRQIVIAAYDFTADGSGYVMACCGGRVFVGVEGAAVRVVGPDSFAVERGSFIERDESVVLISDLSMSPNGDWLAVAGPGSDQQVVLGVIATDGSHTSDLVDLGHDGIGSGAQSIGRIRWLRSGDMIVFGRQVGDGTNLIGVSVDSRRGTLSGAVQALRSGLPLGISFDISLTQRRLVYAGGPSRSQLELIIPTPGGRSSTQTRLTSGTWRHAQPSISWDGEAVAYLKGSGTDWDIYWRRLQGETEQRLTRGARPVGSLAWAPDGSSVAYVAETDSGTALMAVDLSTGTSRRIGSRSVQPGGPPVWSPDGTLILYRSAPAWSPDAPPELGSGRGRTRLVGVDLVSGSESEFTAPGFFGVMTLVYSPDGRSYAALAASGRGAAGLGLWVVPSDGGAPVRLIDGPAVPLAWSPDGSIYFARNVFGGTAGVEIERISARGGVPATHVTLPTECNVGGMAIARDGRTIVCTVAEVESDVWVVDNFLPGS